MYFINQLIQAKSPFDYLLIITTFAILIFAVTIHEYAHGKVAEWMGDLTAKVNGRVTLNPLAHFAWDGILALLVAGFGWGIPVPVNPYNFKNQKLGNVLVSIAGISANLIVAVATATALRIILFVYLPSSGFLLTTILITAKIVSINIGLALFNLLPLPPLDGSKLLAELLPEDFGPIKEFLENPPQYASLLILLILIYTDLVDKILTPLESLLLNILL